MEPVLNLVWLLLAVPAFAVWRRSVVRRNDSRACSAALSLLTVCCVLMLLFPVVSASDDLHPMCTEVEESAAKRVVKALHTPQSQPWSDGAAIPVSHVAIAFSFNQNFGTVSEFLGVLPLQCTDPASGCRAPPAA